MSDSLLNIAMKFVIKPTNLFIDLSLHVDDVPAPLGPETDTNQQYPRRCYVYAHLDNTGQVFYVGKGTGRRAWSANRHPLWLRYVEKHLGGSYQVRILRDNLSEEEVEEIEAECIAQCSDTVVNWVNMGRETDFETLDRRNALRDMNIALIQQARNIEKYDLEKAASMYIRAIEAIQNYAFITYEKGLVGQLLEEETVEFGVHGEADALDRLTICLIKLGRPLEASEHTTKYFAQYRRDLEYAVANRIEKRISKALANIKKLNKGISADPAVFPR